MDNNDDKNFSNKLCYYPQYIKITYSEERVSFTDTFQI